MQVSLLDELKLKILERVPSAKTIKTNITALNLYHIADDEVIKCQSERNILSLIVAGKKQTSISSYSYLYQQGQCLFSGIAAPSTFHAVNASTENPFLAVSLNVDINKLIHVADNLNKVVFSKNTHNNVVFVFNSNFYIQNCFLRLINVLDDDNMCRYIAPLIEEELYYHILFSQCADELLNLITKRTTTNNIIKAANYIKDKYNESLKFDDVANSVNMSPSAFYKNFKESIGVSPLQYQKQIRLMEAKNLFTIGKTSVSQVAFDVGYNSINQFIREYKREFGFTPTKHINNLGNKYIDDMHSL